MRQIDRIEAIVEELQNDFKAMLEIMMLMRSELDEVKKVVSEIPEMKSDIKTIKAALTATNTQVRDHEQRITRLEASSA